MPDRQVFVQHGSNTQKEWVFLERNSQRHVHPWGPSPELRENLMKSMVSIVIIAVAIAFTAPAFAGPGSTITNKEDCEKAGKVWDEAGKKCVEKQ